MRISKKILLFLYSLGVTSIISAGLAFGLELFLGLAFAKAFMFFVVIQLFGPYIYGEFYERKKILEYAEKYSKIPFKRYLISLKCNFCGKPNEVEFDLNESEFRCKNCEKYNGILVEIQTTSKTETINNLNELF